MPQRKRVETLIPGMGNGGMILACHRALLDKN